MGLGIPLVGAIHRGKLDGIPNKEHRLEILVSPFTLV